MRTTRMRWPVAARFCAAVLVATLWCGGSVELRAQGRAEASQGHLTGDLLRDVVAGKRIYLEVPLGGEFPLYYRRDGRVDGSGEAAGLGRFLKPSDSGRWWVDRDRLCQQWQTWYDGKVFCFTVSPEGPRRLRWVRDDGYSGTARVE